LDKLKEAFDVLTTSAGSCLNVCDKCDRTASLTKDEIKEDKFGDIMKVMGQLIDGSKAVEQRLNSIEQTIDGKVGSL